MYSTFISLFDRDKLNSFSLLENYTSHTVQQPPRGGEYKTK